jgi:hypothetical protein
MPNQGRSPVVRGAMKLLVTEGQAYIRNGDGTEELYDLTSDPGQVKNLVASEGVEAALQKFRCALKRLLDDEPPLPQSPQLLSPPGPCKSPAPTAD